MNRKVAASFLIILLAGIMLGAYFLFSPIKKNTPPPKGYGETVTVNGIMYTDGIKHTVPLDEIRNGGVKKDAIPAIDSPKFWSIKETEELLDLSDEEPGITVSVGNVHRFYPFDILVWHEIVNDTIDDEPALITYDPLTNSALAFTPILGDNRLMFGVSGKLWNSNVVLYDKTSETLWSQIRGEAIVGPEAGIKLFALPSDRMTYGDFKKAYPTGQILNRKTGFRRLYEENPYEEYYANDAEINFPVNHKDDRMKHKELIYGMVVNGKAKAYPAEIIKQKGTIRDTIQGVTIIATVDPKTQSIRMYEEKDGKQTRLNPVNAFWFAWVAVHPDTEIYTE